MTIDELHDYCRFLFDENHEHGVPDKWSEGYEFALSLVMFKCHAGLTDEDRKAVADWREKTLEGHEMSRTDTTDPDGLHFFRVKFNDAGEMYGLTQVTTD